jgi:hypothetical protein
MSEGPFTDDMVRHFVMTLQTQDAIQKHGVKMAEFLAEAAIASEKAGRGSAMYALGQWSELIKDHAARLIREKKAKPDAPKLSAPDVIEGKNG